MGKFEIISPVDGSVYASREYASRDMVQTTLSLANRSQASWRKVPLSERADICNKVIAYFEQHAAEMALEITMQMGRPIRYAPLEIKNGFKERARFMIDTAEEALSDSLVSMRDGFNRFIRREPLGVVLVLAPWNYPYLTAVNAVIPAIMAGNSVILKHAEQTAICAERFGAAFEYAGIPKGVFQHLDLTHNQVAEIIGDDRIAYTAFTGSVDGGHAIQRAIGARFVTAGLELGGKDPAYVCEDADLNNTVENLIDGAFFNSGQSCCGIERIYVDHTIFEDFVERFIELTKGYVIGDPRDGQTTLGPMVRQSNAQVVLDHVNEALKGGAISHIGAETFGDLDGPYVHPHVLTNVNHEMKLMREETFGPVVGIMPVKNELEAITLMNNSDYGLTASIWTTDEEKALKVGNEIVTGTWFMNRCDYLDPELAWTGVKNSGKGCTLSTLGYDYLTRPKSFHLKLT